MITINDKRKEYKFWLEEFSDNYFRIYEKLTDIDFVLIYDNFFPNIAYNVYNWNEIKIKPILNFKSNIDRNLFCNDIIFNFYKNPISLKDEIFVKMVNINFMDYIGKHISISKLNFKTICKNSEYCIFDLDDKCYVKFEDFENYIKVKIEKFYHDNNFYWTDKLKLDFKIYETSIIFDLT